MKTKNFIIFSTFSAFQALAMELSPLDLAAAECGMSPEELVASFNGENDQLQALLATFQISQPAISVAPGTAAVSPVINDQFKADADMALALSMLEEGEGFDIGIGHNNASDGELLSMSKIHNIDVETLKFLKENAQEDFNALRIGVQPAQPTPPIEPKLEMEDKKVIESVEELESNYWWTLQLDTLENTQHRLVYDENDKLTKRIYFNHSKASKGRTFDNIFSFSNDASSLVIVSLHDSEIYNKGKKEKRRQIAKLVDNGRISVEQGIRLVDFFGGPSWIAYRMMSIAPTRSIIETMELFPKEYNIIPGEATEIFRQTFNYKYGFSKGSFAEGVVPPAMSVQLELKKILGGDYKDFVVSEQLVNSIYDSLKGTKFLFLNEFVQAPRALNKIEINDLIVFTKNNGFTAKSWEQVISQGLLDSRIGAQPILAPVAPVAKDANVSWKVAVQKYIKENGEDKLNYFYDAFAAIYGCDANADIKSPGKIISDLLLYNAEVKELSSAGMSVKELILQIVSPMSFTIREVERKLTNDEIEAIFDYVVYNEF